MKERTSKVLNFTPVRVVYGVVATLIKRLPRIAFFVLSFFAIFWVGQQLYFKYAPASNFLDFYYVKVDDTPVGTEPLLTLCRRVNTEGIKISAVRSFIQFKDADDNAGQVRAEYQFDAGIEKRDTNCQNLRLKKQPQVAGDYVVHTEYEFYINGNRKSDSYDSNRYKMTPISLSLDEQVKALQLQIDELNRQIDALKARAGSSSTGGSSATTTPRSSPTTSSGATPGPSATSPSLPPVNVPPSAATPPRPACSVNILGLGVNCGSDGLLRL